MKNNLSSKIGGSIFFLRDKTLLHNAKKVLSINGMLITLLAGILVNMVSDYANKIVERQRYKEMLQFEMRSNLLRYDLVLQQYNNNDGKLVNKFVINDEIFKAGLENGYVFDIDLNYLSDITSLYMITIPEMNRLFNNLQLEIDSSYTNWRSCVLSNISQQESDQNVPLCEKEKRTYETTQIQNSISILDGWEEFYSSAEEITISFNPTEERTTNFGLKLMMGNESLEFLK